MKDKNYKLEQVKNTQHKYVLGIDEVGTGSLAGEVFVCAFVAEKDWMLEGLSDSKILSPNKRKDFYNILYKEKYSIKNCHPNNSKIYKEYGSNLHSLLKFLYWNAAKDIIKQDTLIVLDGSIEFPTFPYKLADSISLPKADSLVQQVSAASIIAKEVRDSYMIELDNKYPNYDWKSNKGYPSKSHKDALNKYGACEEHRISYKPIRELKDKK